jgi:histidinol dehydrogenase
MMLAIPAMVAGCKELIVATPPKSDGSIDPVMMYVAKRLGISKIYRMGGAQAIAAMTYGTESVPKVDKLFGPGNTFVTLAKQLAQLEGIPIDMPAGPSEVLVIADASANPAFLAADLLSQAEHGEDSQVILLTTESKQLEEVEKELIEQLNRLPRKEIAKKALQGSRAIVLSSLEEAVEFSNLYAPEHLILAVESPEELIDSITHAGSLFLGHFTPESMGDYASGTNHTLPTNGYARNYSGVSLSSFMKSMTLQKASKKGIKGLGPIVERLAEAEGLTAHKQAVTVRLETLKREEDSYE